MATYLVTDLTFTTIRSRQLGGTRNYRETYGTIFIPASAGGRTYVTGGVPISGITSTVTGLVVAANALACPGLGCPNELVKLTILSSGLPAALDDAYTVLFDSGMQPDGTAPTAPHKLRLMAPPVSVGAVGAHTHDLLVKGGQIGSTTNDVAHYGTDILGKEAATDATIAGSASATKGGVITATPTFTGTAATSANSRLVEHITAALNENLTVYVIAVGW